MKHMVNERIQNNHELSMKQLLHKYVPPNILWTAANRILGRLTWDKR